MLRRAAMAAGVALLAGGGGAWAQTPDDKLVTTLGLDEVRALAIETGGTPREVEHMENNEYRMEIAYPDGLFVQFEGWSCTGADEAKRCGEFMMYIWFEFDSEAEARAMEHEVDIVWLSDQAMGSDLKVWRMDVLAGMTRDRVRRQFESFVVTANAARDIVFPPKDGAKTGGKG